MTRRTTRVVEPQVPAIERRPELSATTGVEEPVVVKLKKRRPPKPGL
jgi:hypothetical protein